MPDLFQPLIIDHWQTPASFYPVGKHGVARIGRERRGRGIRYNEGVRGYFFLKYVTAVDLTVLSIRGRTWMVDEPPFVWSLQSFAERSRGRVLVAGLGLGLVIHELVKNHEVTEIVVVEREKDVIELVSPFLPEDPRLSFINQEFGRFVAADMERGASDRYQTIIWDLAVWGGDSKKRIGFGEMLGVAGLCHYIYGPRTKVFRHGLDRDPAGERLVRKHPELLPRWPAVGF